MSRAVALVAYDPTWPAQARTYGDALRAKLGATIVDLQHIGSTSIPGITAKPVIDLLPIVRSLDELDANAEAVTGLGYDWRGEFGIAGRRFCSLTRADGHRLVNVHFFRADSPEVARHLCFRDYLRAHTDQAREYEAEKARAAALHPDNVEAYTDAKGPWIAACEARAFAWAGTR